MTDRRGRGVAMGLAAALAVVLAVLTIVAVLSPPGPSAGPGPSGSLTAGGPPSAPLSAGPSTSPSAQAGGSPSSIVAPTAGPSASPDAAATRTPKRSRPPRASAPATEEPTRRPRRSREPTASREATPTEAPTASPIPTTAPASGEASIRFVDMGLDSLVAESPRRRLLTFRSEGSGTVRATLSDVTAGRARLCLWRGDADTVEDEQCREMSRGSLTAAAPGGPTTWTVSAITAEGLDVPAVDLTLTFPSAAPSVTIDGFRFQGTAFPEYNGFTAVAGAEGEGTLAVGVRWRGGPQPYSLRIEDAATSATVDERTGNAESVSHDSTVAGPASYRIRLQNRVEVAEQDFLLSGTIAWPGGR